MGDMADYYYDQWIECQALFEEYEPDYDAYIAELESLEASMKDVGRYADWFCDA